MRTGAARVSKRRQCGAGRGAGEKRRGDARDKHAPLGGARRQTVRSFRQRRAEHASSEWSIFAVFPILADVAKVKKGSKSTAYWSIDFIRLDGWLRRCYHPS